MKVKYLFLAVFVVATTMLSAQNVRIGAKGGLNVSNVKFSQDVFQPSNITGFHIGPFVEVMTIIPGFGIDAAILYTQKGAKIHPHAETVSGQKINTQQTIKNEFLEIPVNLKWKALLPVITPYVAAGPYIDLRLAGNKIWDVKTIEDVVGQIESKSFGVGLNFAAGVEVMKTVQLSVTYNLGLAENYKTADFSHTALSGKTRTWVISATVLF